MNNQKTGANSFVVVLILLLAASFFLYFILTMEWVSGGADSYSHYLISRYSFQHPELFFHHWGKPFFTLLSSPFAQLGIKGVEIFNLMCMLLSGYLAFRISGVLHYRYSWLAIIMTMFAPIVFINVFSSVTEPLGALMLTLGIYMLSVSWFTTATILFSFLLFVRNEAIVFLPLVMLYLVWIKKWKYAIFLLAAPLLYSIVGFFYYGSFFWIIEQFPYSGAKEIYNSGSLFSFLDSYQSITHLAVGIAFVLGLAGLIYSWIKNQFLNTNSKLELLISMVIIGYFSAHSVVWWLGIGGSLGLTRVMVLIIPLIAVVGVLGLNTLAQKLPNRWESIFYFLFMLVVIYIPIEREELPKSLDSQQELIKTTLTNFELDVSNKKVAYFHPLVPYYLQMDPFKENCIWLIEKGVTGALKLDSGDFLIWDFQFGEFESRMPFINIDTNTYKLSPKCKGNLATIIFEKR